ncbi:MAG: asparagine synthase (glutamine-hydrolyzing) [Candidatus Tectomicrobia bacterium]|nr:asparagine synthase (glutamine-hydrolyzing) [Candidatus Tectomicrobia bacterium]
MCGICGILNFHGRPISSDLLGKMADALFHRGPEDQGIYLSETQQIGLGLGHRRLKIIDLSPLGRQPMSNEDGTIWIIFNGEIYNFQELRVSLQKRGHRFKSHTDTETIIHLYEEEGERVVERLDGMFAFALWDSNRQTLLLARDRVGKKPLYYYADRFQFTFGSEIKALLGHPEVPKEIHPQAIPLYLVYGYVPTPETFYQGIMKLPPGHTLTVRADGSLSLKQYWDVTYPLKGDEVPDSEDEVIKQLRSLLTKAVEKRLISDVPLGAFLSGGIDSSIVVGLMSQLMDQPVKTFSIGFTGDESYNEVKYARIIANRFQTDHHEFIVKPDAFTLVEKLIWHYDEPFGDSSAIPTYLLSQLTREEVTVALNGDGGDELFAGYERFYAAQIAERIPSPLRQLGLTVLQALPDSSEYDSLIRKARRFLVSAGKPLAARFLDWNSFFRRDLLEEFIQAPWDQSLIQASFDECLSQTNGLSLLSKVLYVNMKTYLLDDLLVKMDRMAMAHALEARSPFLDRELIEYTARLPDKMKLKGITTKYILKKAFADLLPQEILTRKKHGFGVPLGAWFRAELKDYIREILLSSQAELGSYLRGEAIARMIDDHLARKRDFGQQLWTLLTLEVWLRQMKRGV